MKNIEKIISILLLFVSSFALAQIVDIPDANFKAALINYGVDANSDGEIQVIEANNQLGLALDGENISDLTGIEVFVALDNLDVRNNQLTNIDLSSNTNLKFLNVRNNQLTSIDLSNNPNLESLFCDDNQIVDLDVSNCIDLIYLYCSNNQIANLFLDNNTNLGGLIADGNLLTNLDLSNTDNLVLNDFSNNPNLTYINLKNGNNEVFSLNGVSSHFNNLPNLELICIDDIFSNTTLQIQNVVSASVVFSEYCSFTPGGNYNTITGVITFDAQNNGCDINDDTFPFIKINIDDGAEGGSTFTNSSGEYNFYTQDGTFTVTPAIENASFFNILPTNAPINFPDTNNNIEIQDFCITANGVHPDIEIAIAPTIPARPGFDAEYLITYKNKGNQTVSGDVTFSYDDTVLDFISSTETPTSESTGFLSWDYSNLLPFESRNIYVTLNVNGPMETPAINIDDQLDFTANVNPVVGDELPADNTFDFKQTVIGAYDPNDITCIQGDIVNPSEIGEFLHYLIRFENTGNAAAENVVVKTEVNPAQFDISTLQLLSSSHNPYVKVTGNTMEFIFENIFLEASGGHGNILLRMQTKEDLQINDTVTKDAEIFFDYNFPIETNDANTTFATLSNADFEIDKSVSLYPNPVKDALNIKASSTIKSVSVYDVQGRLLQTTTNSTSEINIDLSTQPNGMYFVKIITDKGTNVEKIVKD